MIETPIQALKEFDLIIFELKHQLKFSKNKPRDGKRINRLIDVLKILNDTIVSDYYLDSVDSLILAQMESYLFEVERKNKKIPINLIIDRISKKLETSREMVKSEVLKSLRAIEIQRITSEIPVVKISGSQNVKIDRSRISKNELNDYYEKLKNITPIAQWDVMIEKILSELKMQMKWSAKLI